MSGPKGGDKQLKRSVSFRGERLEFTTVEDAAEQLYKSIQDQAHELSGVDFQRELSRIIEQDPLLNSKLLRNETATEVLKVAKSRFSGMISSIQKNRTKDSDLTPLVSNELIRNFECAVVVLEEKIKERDARAQDRPKSAIVDPGAKAAAAAAAKLAETTGSLRRRSPSTPSPAPASVNPASSVSPTPSSDDSGLGSGRSTPSSSTPPPAFFEAERNRRSQQGQRRGVSAPMDTLGEEEEEPSPKPTRPR